METSQAVPTEKSKKRPRDEEVTTTATIDPTSIFQLPNAPHLAQLLPKTQLPQTQIKNIMKKAAGGLSNKPDAVYLVTKAAECLLSEFLSAAISKVKQEQEPTAKRAKLTLTYDDLQTAFEELKQKSIVGVTPDLTVFDKILPARKKDEKTVDTSEASTAKE